MSKPSKPKLSQQSQHYGRLGHDVQRPRRPDPDDVIYLQGLPLSSTSGDEASLAARAALLSLSQSLASLCGDERGSEIIEKCIRIGIVSNEDEEEQLEVLEGENEEHEERSDEITKAPYSSPYNSRVF